ncbi:MAG: replicative DNA helicase [Clostridia bacterium]|nr:replicative DNA helicase [Clostridia bacterium]
MEKRRYSDKYDTNANGLNLPYSLEAEQAVLGSVLIEGSMLDAALKYLQPNMFYLPEHQAIYRVMVQMANDNQVIDFLTVLNALKSEDLFKEEDGKSYLMKLTQVVPSYGNIELYAKIVKEKYDIRRTIQVCRQVYDEGMSPEAKFQDLIDSAEQKIFDIREGRKESDLEHVGELVSKNIELYCSMSNPEEREQLEGIPTGMPELDGYIKGLNRDNLIIIGARPGVGKSSFILNLARNVAVERKRPVAVFNLEMSKEQMVTRLLSSEAKISGERLSTGNLNPAEWKRIMYAGSTLTQAPLYFDDTPSITVPEIKAKVRRVKGISAIFIDYLQLMHSAIRTENRVQEVSEITRSLKIMAKELHVPVIACAQLTRGSEKARRPSLPDLRESGSIEQDADQVLFLYRDEMRAELVDDPTTIEYGTAEIIVAKNRHGGLGKVVMGFEKEFTQFTSRSPEENRDDNGND